jgi:hypothetical protein
VKLEARRHEPRPVPLHHGKRDNFSVLPARLVHVLRLRREGERFTFFKSSRPRLCRGREVGWQQDRRRGWEVSRIQEGPDPREPLWR